MDDEVVMMPEAYIAQEGCSVLLDIVQCLRFNPCLYVGGGLEEIACIAPTTPNSLTKG